MARRLRSEFEGVKRLKTLGHLFKVIVQLVHLGGLVTLASARRVARFVRRLEIHRTKMAPLALEAARPIEAEPCPVPFPDGAEPQAHPYRAAALEGSALAQNDRLEAWAKEAFAHWVKGLPSARRDAAALRGVTAQVRLIGRLVSTLEVRRLAWQKAPYEGPERAHGAAIDAGKLDPFDPPTEVRQRSRYVSLCRACSGAGQLDCPKCDGVGRFFCIVCEGDGLDAQGMPLKCQKCRGKGSSPCQQCNEGKLDCASCDRCGRLEHWLEAEVGPRRHHLRVCMDGSLPLLWWTREQATDEEIARDATTVCAVTRDRALEESDLPAEVPEAWSKAHWPAMSPRLDRGERIATQTFTLLQAPVVELTCVFGNKRRTISFEGSRRLMPPASAD
jgi:hypothetical protein